MQPEAITLVGRTSSHYTRVARIFAEELGTSYAFRPVPDLFSRQPADYAGNPALRLPILETPQGTWFGTSNICRELWRRAARKLTLVWPEDFTDPLLANAQELTAQAMASEVSLIMARADGAGEGRHLAKLRDGLANTLGWLDDNVGAVLARLPPERDLSYLEVTLYCLVTHLAFRDVIDVTPYAELARFSTDMERRPSAQATPYLEQR